MAKAIWLLSIGVWYVAWIRRQREHTWMFRYEWPALIAYIVLSACVLLAVT